MNHIACATVRVAALSVAAYPQQSVDKPKAQTCGYGEVYKKNGWVIPGVDGAKKAWRTTVPNRNGVYMTKLEPIARAAVIQRLSCSREHVGRLEIEDVEVGITSLSSFDVGGRIFAYNLT